MCVGPLAPPKMPAPPPPPSPPKAAPKKTDAGVQAARTDEKQRIRAMAGRSSTIATGAQGLTDNANTTGKKLLGQ